MKKLLAVAVLTVALLAALTVPALAVDGSGGAGATYGLHHAMMAQEMGGFTGAMNPGVHHRGFSGWMGGMPMP